MIRGLEGVLASRKAFIDATASRDAVAAGHAASAANASSGPAKPVLQQLVEKPAHGFVGLFNQGATCYLNSFVEALYMLPEMREALFRFKLPAGLSKTSSVAAQLQALFFRLRAGANGATGTGPLTRSFGWGVEEVFQQQDVQELFQKVFEALHMSVAAAKDKADGAPNDNAELAAVLQGFSGLQHSYVECQTCHNRNVRPDPFLNLCLPVKGVASLQEALKATMAPEVLEGSNAYRCSGVCNSKQKALKGSVFQRFPRTFSIQLLRFEMDWNVMQRIKTTSSFSFPPRLNLHEYLEPGKAQNETPKEDCEYELFSVLIHAGAAAAGHYYAYILDAATGRFVKYNDANVDWLNDEEYNAIFGEMSAAQKEEAAKLGATVPASAASSASSSSANSATKSDADIAASIASPDAFDSDDEDEAVRAARRLAIAKKAVPFVDPKRHAYILMYRRVAPAKREEAKESEANGAVAASANGSSSMSEAEFQSLLADRAPELEAENAEFVRRFAEAKAAANRVIIEVNYNPLASLGAAGADNGTDPSVAAKEEKSVEADAAAKASDDDDHAAGMHAALRVTKIEVERDITLGELLATVHKQLGLASSGIELSNARLRGWDGLRHVGEKPFADSELSRTLKQLRWRVRKPLLLETRAEGQSFPLYKPRQLGLELIELDSVSDQYLPSRHFEVDHDAVLSELRLKVASMMSNPNAADGSAASAASSISPQRVKLILSSCGLAVELVEQSKSLTALRVVKGDTIYAELLPLTADGVEIHFDTVGSKSRVLDKFDSRANLVEIQFNNPLLAATPETISGLGLKGPPPSWSSHKVEIDSRSSLLALKQAVSAALGGLSLESFRLRTNHAGPELKELSKVLSFFGLNGLIFTELGQPLKANQFVIRCLRWAPEKIKTPAPQAPVAEEEKQQGSSSVPVAPPGPPMAPSMAPPAAPAAPPIAPSLSAPPMPPAMSPPAPPGPPRAPGLAAPPLSSPSPSPPPTGSPSLASSALVLGPSDPFDLLGDLVMDEAWSLDQVKTAILTAFPSSGLPSDPALIRIREKLASKLTKVFHSDKTLKSNAAAGTLKDFKILVAQAVDRPEDAAISSKHFLLQVVQWIPQQKILAPAREMVLHMDLKLEELQVCIANKYNEEHASEIEAQKVAAPAVDVAGAEVAAAAASSSSSSAAPSLSSSPSLPLPPSSIGFEKPLPYQLLDPAAMSSLKFNVDWLTSTSTLSNSQVIRVRDGDTLVWVDQRANRVEQYNAWRESDDIVHGEKRGEREKQRELKIYTPQEQLEMEAAIQAVQAFERQQQQQQAALVQKPA